jgi:hypothetical protein
LAGACLQVGAARIGLRLSEAFVDQEVPGEMRAFATDPARPLEAAFERLGEANALLCLVCVFFAEARIGRRPELPPRRQ